MLGLQERTIREVGQARNGKRLMRVAASSLFAEYAAPGLIELFVSRAADLDVELSVHKAREFRSLLSTRAVDVAIGPKPSQLPDHLGPPGLLELSDCRRALGSFGGERETQVSPAMLDPLGRPNLPYPSGSRRRSARSRRMSTPT
jgi:DNA-binding transcriptional LysR family regulator